MLQEMGFGMTGEMVVNTIMAAEYICKWQALVSGIHAKVAKA